MRIRWKLLILLLAAAGVPLAIVRVSDALGVLRLGREQAQRTREDLISRGREQLRQLVNYHAAALHREGKLVELAVEVQARELEKILASEPPSDAQPLFSDDYDRGTNIPADLGPSPKHLRTQPDRSPEPIPVTLSEQVFKLAPGVDAKAVGSDIARLTQMTPVYRFLREADLALVCWQYVALENGVHACYPGHGGYPAEFDPRRRDWYRYIRDTGSFNWTAPYVDVSTNQIAITAGMPVSRPDGTFAGITAIDVLVTDVVNRVAVPAYISNDYRAILVALSPREDTSQEGLLIIARQGYADRDRRWDTSVKLEWLESPDRDALAALMQDMKAGKSGVRTMRYEERESLWAYGITEDRAASFVLIVPQQEIIAQAVAAEQEVLGSTWRQLRITGVISACVAATLIIVAFLASRPITRPIRQLAAAARSIAAGDFNTRVDIHTRDELGQLGRAFNEMVPQLQDGLKLRQAISLAMEVQQHLLPSKAPQIAGFDVAGTSIYCDETGGDYYDFLDMEPIGPGTLGIAVGDVTGHGIAAALVMSTGRALLRSHAGAPRSLTQTLNDINRHLTADTPAGRFMTLFYATLDSEDRRIRWISAGHDAAIVYDPAEKSFEEFDGHDIPLGINTTWQYRECGPRTLKPGQVVVIGTDGIWEAHGPRRDMFGKDRLKEIIRHNASRNAADISCAITEAVANFRQARAQEDDITLVVIKVTP